MSCGLILNWGTYRGLYGCFPKLGVPFWGPNNKDYSILGSILGSPYFGKLLYRLCGGGPIKGCTANLVQQGLLAQKPRHPNP